MVTFYPLFLSDYPNMHSDFPFHLAIHRIVHFPAHRHDFLEFSLVIEGEGYQTINGVKCFIKPGTFTFISPYQIHEIHSATTEPLVLYNCIFDMGLLMGEAHQGEALLQLLYYGANEEEQTSFDLNTELFFKFKIQLESMYEEYIHKTKWNQAMIKTHLIQVLISFDRYRETLGKRKLTTNPTTAHPRGIWPIVYYIHSHYNENITLSHLSKRFNVSIPYLSDQFKKYMGQNFVSFLHEVRIRHACSLLLSTNLPVSDIALEVGYQSFQTFSRAFRDLKKVPPTRYRKLQDNDSNEFTS